MKTTNNTSKTTTTNMFAKALGALINATKNKISKKDWSVLLGVSEAALSQWTTGKTFPEPGKLRMIVRTYDKYNLDEHEKEKFHEFMCVLEHPMHKVWKKASSRVKEKNLSDYMLEELENDLCISSSVLYYRLKSELYNQFLRQVEILKDDIKLKFSDYQQQGASFYEVAVSTKEMQGSFQKSTNVGKLTEYVEKVKNIHVSYNHSFKVSLKAMNFSEREDETQAIEYPSLPIVWDQIKKISLPLCTTACYHPEISVDRRADNGIDRVQAVILNSMLWKGSKVLHSNWINKHLERSSISKLGSFFAIKESLDKTYDIIFKDPFSLHEELLTIQVKARDRGYENKSNVTFLKSLRQSLFKYEISAFITNRHSNEMLCSFGSVGEDSDYLFVSGYDSGKDNNDISKNFHFQLSKDNAHSTKILIRKLNLLLITPENTQRRYTVKMSSSDNLENSIDHKKEAVAIVIDIGIDKSRDAAMCDVFRSMCDPIITPNRPRVYPLAKNSVLNIDKESKNKIALIIQEC